MRVAVQQGASHVASLRIVTAIHQLSQPVELAECRRRGQCLGSRSPAALLVLFHAAARARIISSRFHARLLSPALFGVRYLYMCTAFRSGVVAVPVARSAFLSKVSLRRIAPMLSMYH